MTTIFRNLAGVLVLTSPVVLASCNYIAPVMYLAEGPPKAPAVATLDGTRPTVFFVDDRRSVLPKRDLRDSIGEVAGRTLLNKGVMQPEMVIASRDAHRTASRETHDRPLSIVDVGRLVGAEVVVYVNIYGFRLYRDDTGVAPTAAATVKIFDTVANEKIWPLDQDAHVLRIELPRQPGRVGDLSLADTAAAERELANVFGLRVARLFFTAERDKSLGE